MGKSFKYKIALSFATEDFKIANSISNELSRLHIKHYLFTEEESVGKDLLNETWRVYKKQSMFTLMLITENYVKKRWSGVERQVMQTVNRGKGIPYIIPLRVDNTPVDGLSNNISYWTWNDNPSEIAISIYRLIKVSENTKKKKKKKRKVELREFSPNAIPANYQHININKVKGKEVNLAQTIINK